MSKSKLDRPTIHVVSDLHVEFAPFKYGTKPDADIIVVAGDAGAGFRGLNWIMQNWPHRPVAYVAGNHEFYREMLPIHRKALAAKCEGTNVYFLDRKSVEIMGVRFIGATLWTDFSLDGNQDAAMREAEEAISDYFEVRIAPGIALSAEYVLKEHQLDRQFIETELTKPFDGRTVVVTHHAPCPLSIHETFLGDPINPSFVSDLESLIVAGNPDLWLHGHVHNSMDYFIGRTRVLANPRGYPSAVSGHENGQFRESLVLGV